MRTLSASVVIAAMAMPVSARLPDMPGLPVCQDDEGRVVEMLETGLQPGIVLFWTASDQDPMGEVVLADCEIGRALRVRQGKAEDSLDSAARIMARAAMDSAPHTMADIQASLTAKGYRASRGMWPVTHCACAFAQD